MSTTHRHTHRTAATGTERINRDRSATAAEPARTVWQADDIRALGAATDLVTAGAILGIGKTKSHELARAGRFPVPVLRHGHRYLVPVAPILQLLHLDPPAPTPPAAPTVSSARRRASPRPDLARPGP